MLGEDLTADVKRVYAFGKDAEGNNVTEGNKDMKNILGGKGANLAEMALIGLARASGLYHYLPNLHGICKRE